MGAYEATSTGKKPDDHNCSANDYDGVRENDHGKTSAISINMA